MMSEDIDVVPSGAALSKVSEWLGVAAEKVLQDSNAEVEEMFVNPRPALLGLGAKHLSHKAMERSGIELKLGQRLKKSMTQPTAAAAAAGSLQPGQQLRQHSGKRKLDGAGSSQLCRREKQHHDSTDDSDSELEGRGQLGGSRQRRAAQRPPSAGTATAPAAAAPAGKKRTLPKSELLAVPEEHLSKWQRKKRNKKLRQQQEQAASGS